ncbi:hypothetical protein [Epilithonimonas arachidiradicis]|uniref:AsmA-like protein n=1 Tax=Epilithonimonas arachidiradicis TaxID=1617282 RepID=A0A420DD69_9FLAO|nr:hypothetical protein [Epilithonimonas arachidiradicis]RKE89845.1 hypothetical protein BXY58_0424 [Epilithonimonas arachidiradicis]GGG45742.1 hypothetical protein GCM10007332_04040 [Epilithonimonas arachidiradicis]
MKKTLKICGIVLGSILLLILIVNIGFSLWLKYKLPDYLKNKTPYEISYQSLNVEILSGSISANQIKVKTKQPNNLERIALDGSLEGLNISRLSIIQFLKNDRIEANSIKLTKPNLQVRLAKPKVDKTGKNPIPFTIKNIEIENGNIGIKKSDQTQLFSAKDLNLDVKNLSLNQNPNELPFALDSYNITAKDFFFRLDQVYSISCSDITTNNGKLEITDFEMKSLVDFKNWEQSFRSQKSLFGIKSKSLIFDELVFSKTNLSLKNAKIKDPEFVIQNRDNKVVKTNKEKSQFDLNFENVDILNGKLSILKANGKKTLSIAKFDANIKSFLMNEDTSKNKLPFSYQDYKITGSQFFYDAGKYYTMDLSSFNMTSQHIDLMNFKLNPKVTRAAFVRMIPMENDLFDISAKRIQLNGLKWKFEKDQPDILLKEARLTNVDANIFRSKIPKDNPKEKLLYSKLLRSIKFPLVVENLNLVQSKLVYEEDKPDSNGPGKVFFTNFNMNVKNLNSNKRKGANTKVPIVINCRFMDASPMKVNWNFDTANMRDNFTIGGYINHLPANDINPFIKPYMNITATGTITGLNFDFKGNNDIMNGKFRITHKDLKVTILDKNTKEKKKFLSAVANLVVKKDSKKFPESVDIYVERNKQRSFFNFYWKGIEDGLKKSLLVIKID